MPMKQPSKFKGKAIYEPSGAAYEYCHWACNLYNGCSNTCSYCYNRHGITSAILGVETVSLKKSLIDEKTAFAIFEKELVQAKKLMKPTDSLFFSFVSDPMLPETRDLTTMCVEHALEEDVKVQVLTKCTDWVFLPRYTKELQFFADSIAIGFTLTGMESMESYCRNNTAQRIKAMEKLKELGIKTFASIEPVVDINKAVNVVRKAKPYCDFFKVGLVTKMGVKFSKEQVEELVAKVQFYVGSETPIYWKKSIRDIVGDELVDSWENSVPSDYDLFNPVTIKR